jgi:hypothetical protein
MRPHKRAELCTCRGQGLTALCTVQSGQIGIWDVKRRKWRTTLMGHTSFVRAGMSSARSYFLVIHKTNNHTARNKINMESNKE